MGLFENFPYANFHELNLDWILHELKELETEITNFVAINSVKYANPIVWDITSQYETNTVVLDSSGNAYLSVQPVPAGVALDREEYWTKIGNFSALWDSVRSAITPYDEQHSKTASVDHKAGDWVWLENDLLLITKNITAGDKYVDGSNCKKTNVHDLFVTLGDTVTNEVNTLSSELQDEIMDRENADNTLNGKITAEAQARAAADEKLTDDIAKTGSITNFKAFGAVGDGLVDDTQAIKNCLAYAAENKKAIMGNFGTYKITDTIDINGATIRYCHCEGLIKPAFNDKAAVVIHNAGNQHDTTGDYEFHVMGETPNGGYNFIRITDFNIPELPFKGISVKNCYHSNFVLTARNCHIGVCVEATGAGGNGGGCGYNTFNITDAGDNAVSIDIMAKDDGWVNQNLFLNASVQDYSSNPNPAKLIGIRLWSNNSSHTPNNNTFINTSLQCTGVPVVLDNASANEFTNTRCESSGRPQELSFYVMTKNICKRNIFNSLYDPETENIFNTDLAAANNFGNAGFKTGTASKQEVFSWIYNKQEVVKTGNSLFVNNLDSYCPYEDLTSGQPSYAYGDFNDNGITPFSNNAFGRYFDISKCQNIMALAHSDGDLRYSVFLFDASFNFINASPGDVNDTNSQGIYSDMILQNVSNKKYFTSPNNANNELIIFNINNSNAKYAFIGVSGGNISALYFYNYYAKTRNLVTSNILPKRMCNIDNLKITSATGLKVSSIGQFVRDCSAKTFTETDGKYMQIGYVRTGGTDDAQEFATLKAKVG